MHRLMGREGVLEIVQPSKSQWQQDPYQIKPLPAGRCGEPPRGFRDDAGAAGLESQMRFEVMCAVSWRSQSTKPGRIQVNVRPVATLPLTYRFSPYPGAILW
jgi:hypothetical protein